MTSITTKRKAARTTTPGAATKTRTSAIVIDETLIVTIKTKARVDSRVLARQLGNQHQNTYELLKQYQSDFETFGILRFQTGEIDGRGQPEKFAMLNEDQAYLLLTYSRNTARTRQLKVRLVKAFGEARRAVIQHGAEYLPTYHQLHDDLHALAAGSSNEKFIHMNFNKLINRAAGIATGQRGAVPMPVQSMLCVAQTVATQAIRCSANCQDAHQRAKTALLALSTATLIGG